jgi:hypothetical protein
MKIPTSCQLRCGLLALSIISLCHVTRAATPISTPILPLGPPQASAGTAPSGPNFLWYQTDGKSSFKTNSQDYEPANNAFDDNWADDFIIPPGETWTIQQVYAHGGYFSGATGTATSVNVIFYSPSGTFPGAAIPGGTFLNVAMQDTAGDFMITLPSDMVLTEGVYWISVQANMNLTTAGRWGWYNFDFPFEFTFPAAWQNPGGGFMTPCTSWGTYMTCFGAPDTDASFILFGTSVGGPTPTPSATATATPTATAAATPTGTPPATPTPPTSPTSTPTPTPTPTVTPTPGFCGWFNAPPVPTPISDAAVTSLGGSLYSFSDSTAYKFNGTTWTTIAPMPVALSGHAAVNDGTYIYIVGGYASTTFVDTLYRYDPVANSYTTLAHSAAATAYSGAACLGGKIYKIGGYLGSIQTSFALEIYDIATNTWTVGANYPIPAFLMGTFVHNGFIYTAGGSVIVPVAGSTTKTYRYDPVANTWNDGAIADLPQARSAAATGFYNGGGIVAGGAVGQGGGTSSPSVIFWDPTSNTWSNMPSLLGARTYLGGAVLNDSFYCVGGSSASGSTSDNQKLTCPQAPTPTPPTSTPTPTPTSTSTPTPTLTPAPTPGSLGNISTRMRVQAGDNALIGGFIIAGSAPKNVAVRGIGPSLSQFGVPDVLADPTLELHNGSGATLVQNDNWQDDPLQAAQLTALGLNLSNPNESGLVATLQPNAPYTAILAGKNNGTGVGLVEIYDTNPAASSQLANISTRGFVLTGDNVMIGGFILGGTTNANVVVRGIGPSLSQFGLNPVVADPTLELHDGNGALLVSNDNWQDDPATAALLSANGLGLSDVNESGIFQSLPPGAFTAILAGKNGGTGIGLVEIYNLH